MASASLRDEVTCSICLDVYRDPVTLRCGHNFCRVCIACELGTQDRSRVYKCPVCRKRFTSRPELEKNINLCNIAHRFPSTGPEQVETGVFCTYCEFPVPATKTCLQCETSMCDRHLRIHNRSVGHVLISPTTNLENRKCSVHKKILEYYCTEDSACICVSCRLDGDHRGHQVETLDEASEKKKEKLRNVLQKLISKKEETERRAQSLEERRRDVQDKAAGERERVTALIRDSRRQLEDLEKRLLSEISRQEERVSLSVSDLIRQLEIKKDELSRKMSHIEELCNMTDPLTVLQEQESDRDGSSDSNEEDDEDTERDNNLVHDVGDLDVGLISQTLQKGLSDIISGVKRRFALPEPTVILLDVNTAANNVVISGYLKTASGSDLIQNHPETPERFQYYPQVLSMMRFSSGRHYWEVDASNSNSWRIGMCYPSIERRGRQSHIGNNNKSWCLGRYNTDYTVMYDNKVIQLSHNIPCNRVRVYLDYEAGRLSFSSLCDPIRHLHTFTATFTEPLHAVICVWQGSLKICN